METTVRREEKENEIFSKFRLGSKAMAASHDVGEILTKHYENGKICAAICAGPRALLSHKIGAHHHHKITCYPSVRKEFTEGEPYKLDAPHHSVCHSTHTEKGLITFEEKRKKHLVSLFSSKELKTKNFIW